MARLTAGALVFSIVMVLLIGLLLNQSITQDRTERQCYVFDATLEPQNATDPENCGR